MSPRTGTGPSEPQLGPGSGSASWLTSRASNSSVAFSATVPLVAERRTPLPVVLAELSAALVDIATRPGRTPGGDNASTPSQHEQAAAGAAGLVQGHPVPASPERKDRNSQRRAAELLSGRSETAVDPRVAAEVGFGRRPSKGLMAQEGNPPSPPLQAVHGGGPQLDALAPARPHCRPGGRA